MLDGFFPVQSQRTRTRSRVTASPQIRRLLAY